MMPQRTETVCCRGMKKDLLSIKIRKRKWSSRNQNLPRSNFPLPLPLHQCTESVTSNSATALLSILPTTVSTENTKPYVPHTVGKNEVCPCLRKKKGNYLANKQLFKTKPPFIRDGLLSITISHLHFCMNVLLFFFFSPCICYLTIRFRFGRKEEYTYGFEGQVF